MLLLDLTFSDSIKLIIIEKLLIDAFLLLVGLVAKWVFERLKTKQSLEAELNKLRVDKIGECWAVHSKYAMLLNEFINSLNKYRKTDLSDAQIVEKLSPKMIN